MFIDIVFLGLMLLACLKGYSKGLIVALFSILAFMAGLAAALKLSAYAAERLSGTFNSSGKWLPALAFFLVFVVVALLVRLGARLLQKTVEMAMLGWINKVGGIILYAILYAMLLSVFLFYTVQMKIISADTVAASQAYPFLKPLGPLFIDSLGTIIPWFKGMFAQLQEFFGRVPVQSPQP